MKILRTLTYWMALTLLSLTCNASDYYFRTVDARDGLADNFVRDIVSDSYGYIWFSTINGLSRYDGYRFSNYMPHLFGGRSNDISFVRETADTTLWMMCEGELFSYQRDEDQWKKDGAERLKKLGVEGKMRTFYVDDRHHLWAATEMGLYHYDYSARRLHHIANYSKSPILHIISKNGVTIVVTIDYKIYEVALKERRLMLVSQAPAMTYTRDSRVYLDNNMNLWLFNSHSLAGSQWVFSLKNHQWHLLSELMNIGSVFVNTLTEDNEGNLWLGTGNTGLFVFAYHDEDHLYTKVAGMKAFLPQSSHISCFYLDENNTLWVGSAKLGAAFTDLNGPNFNLVSTGEYEDVSSMVEDTKGNLWIGFDGGGISMKSATGALTHFSASQGQLPSNIVTSLTVRPDGTVLTGTYGGGIAKFDGHRFVPLYADYPNLNYVKAMVTDAHGNLWVATVDKGVVRVTAEDKIVCYDTENSPLLANGILCLAYDPLLDKVYIGSSMGISVYDCGKEQFVNNPTLEKLNGSYVSSLMVSNRNILFIGTRNGLWVFRPKDTSIRQLTTLQGMSHNTVRALAQCGNQVWASTDNGLTCIFCENGDNGHLDYKCFPFLDSDGLHNVIFSNDAALTTSGGMALLGCFTGYVCIQPENIVSHFPKLRVLFTDFRVNGEMVSKSIERITIHHDDQLGLSVSAMVPAQNHKIKYYYRFKGNDEWMSVPGNILNFVSLHQGKHVLQVKAALPGMMESAVAEFPIKVLPPLWLSNWALLLYLLLFLAAVYFITRAMRLRQKREIAIKQLELNLEKYEMEEEKIRFFTNISHDLKTPLTLVVAPLEKVRQSNLPAPIRTELDVAWRNARQLYDLILQLLDFRRLDVGKEKLTFKHGDIVDFVRQTVQGFAYYATHKQIKIQMKLPPDAMEIDFDENKMRRIITNLLSNAFKYNVDNGMVTVSLHINQQPQAEGKDPAIGGQMVLSVADTGIGVNDKHHIFDRFVQETHGQEQEGSGLGLHIVRQYVTMMGGHIAVADNKPQGTVFTVTLPVTKAVGDNVEELVTSETDTEYSEGMAEAGSEDKPTILVVDDNVDTRLFLQRSLDDQYHVLVAENGKDALAVLARTDHVSIVVSDVMMPVMDGIELFRSMRGNINFSHIPVILLTAKSSEENIVAGLEEGVADYITKPFSLAVLRLRIRKILEWTQNVHHKVASGIEIKPSEVTVSSLDEELISHVIAHIEANIQDQDYSVVRLSSAVGMTRGHLYKKLMAITGKSPLEFIRIIKVKRGKSLLDQGKTNISEVADMVGFSSKQFAHYFKMMYGKTPSEYLKDNKRSL